MTTIVSPRTETEAQTYTWDRNLTSKTASYAAGKALRTRTPRTSHAEWTPGAKRPDPISLLEEENRSRLKQLVPIRFGRMALSPFAFYRGGANIMANDLATTPTTGIMAHLCGDAHISNFGAYAAPDRRLVFDVNDFDETHVGPWEWDLKRLAVSVALVARQNGYTSAIRRQAVLSCVRNYRERMQAFAQMTHLQVWYARVEMETLLAALRNANIRGHTEARIEWRVKRAESVASKRTNLDTFPKLAEVVDGQYRIKDEPPLISHFDPLDPDLESLDADRWHAFVREYITSLPDELRMLVNRYRIVDLAQKVVGVGSVGTRCAVVLALGGAEGDDPLFIQIKEASASVLEPYLGPSVYANHGQRVVVGQRLMQAASDILLGWSTMDGRDYYSRQLRDMKFSAEIEAMHPKVYVLYVGLCGATLARAHARTSDPARISGYLGRRDTFDQAIAAFAEAYADQTERDHARLLAAIQEGRVKAQTGV
ncbi:MAG TPA: DUF2252 domain-containing protein [Ktedonobacterales bacterium]|jgi:uncharacterized protein (DUF2252 family)